MKKHVWAVILCLVLSAPVLSFAEQYPTEAVRNDFTVALDEVKQSGNKFIIRLSAYFASRTDAERHGFTIPPIDRTADVPQYTLHESEAYSECPNIVHSGTGGKPRHMTPEEMEKSHSICRKYVSVAFKTLSGEVFAPNGSFDMLQFGGTGQLDEQKDGRWRLRLVFEATGFSTSEKGVILEFSTYDPHDDRQYTGEAEQTMSIEFP